MKNIDLRGLTAFALLFVFLPSNGQQVEASFPVRDFICTDYSQGKVFLFHNDSIIWQHEAPLSNDVWVLRNGHVLFTTGQGVLEMTLENDTVFEYKSKNHIFACQRLKNGNTFIGECESGLLLEVRPNGKIVRRVCILPEGVANGKKSFIRNARRLDNGHYLVAHYGGKKVVEYDNKGRTVWEIPISGGAHSVIRLPNGNTLVAVTDADKNPRVEEYTPQKELVWQLTNDDFPNERPLKFISGMHFVPGKGLFFTNWQGHGKKENHPHMFLVNKQKEVLYRFLPRDGIETLSSVMVLDDGTTNVLH